MSAREAFEYRLMQVAVASLCQTHGRVKTIDANAAHLLITVGEHYLRKLAGIAASASEARGGPVSFSGVLHAADTCGYGTWDLARFILDSVEAPFPFRLPHFPVTQPALVHTEPPPLALDDRARDPRVPFAPPLPGPFFAPQVGPVCDAVEDECYLTAPEPPRFPEVPHPPDAADTPEEGSGDVVDVDAAGDVVMGEEVVEVSVDDNPEHRVDTPASQEHSQS
ncbi:hypothetical protein KIPB_001297 [Kipferlia bialata]|uniref:Bromodomain associated domain-containing protein n=1 Tax=Kipferlia bialata TaxID=797122 RepID=A0A391NLR7_9EUKA|nr:hypothetical protein KIPB_001297 [Kipferlia bialata]|eukprot:g1297.t1